MWLSKRYTLILKSQKFPFVEFFYTFCNVLQEAQNKDSNVKLIKLDSLIVQCAPKKSPAA